MSELPPKDRELEIVEIMYKDENGEYVSVSLPVLILSILGLFATMAEITWG